MVDKESHSRHPALSSKATPPLGFQIMLKVWERGEGCIALTGWGILESTDHSRDEFVPFADFLAQPRAVSVSGVVALVVEVGLEAQFGGGIEELDERHVVAPKVLRKCQNSA